MFDELIEIVKEFFKKLFTSRLFALARDIHPDVCRAVGKLFHMQILNGDEYQDNLYAEDGKKRYHTGNQGQHL